MQILKSFMEGLLRYGNLQVPSISPFDMHTPRLLSPHPHAYLTAAGSPHSWPSVFPEILNLQASQAERSSRLARPWSEGQPWGILSIFWIGQVCMSTGQMALPSSRILTCLVHESKICHKWAVLYKAPPVGMRSGAQRHEARGFGGLPPF